MSLIETLHSFNRFLMYMVIYHLVNNKYVTLFSILLKASLLVIYLEQPSPFHNTMPCSTGFARVYETLSYRSALNYIYTNAHKLESTLLPGSKSHNLYFVVRTLS